VANWVPVGVNRTLIPGAGVQTLCGASKAGQLGGVSVGGTIVGGVRGVHVTSQPQVIVWVGVLVGESVGVSVPVGVAVSEGVSLGVFVGVGVR